MTGQKAETGHTGASARVARRVAPARAGGVVPGAAGAATPGRAR